jgi:tRNA dimethylallyltransferase
VTDLGNRKSEIVLAGPTGTGKSDLALRLARAVGGEIVNYDSVQIYRGFDIGSAKPSAETRALVPHHLYDIVDADEEFNAADYARRARPVIDDILARGRTPILVGGTFFYLRALLSGLPEMPGKDATIRGRISAIADRPRGPRWLHRWLSKVDPQSGRKIALKDRHRVERALEVWLVSGRPISSWQRPPAGGGEIGAVVIGLTLERKVLVEALDRRVERMYADGLVEETRGLLARFPKTARPFDSIGYREAVAVIGGEMSVAEAVKETARRTRGYAKRQMTWLRAEPNVRWLDASKTDEAYAAAMRLVSG